jgi:hypothetical protein
MHVCYLLSNYPFLVQMGLGKMPLVKGEELFMM